VSEQYIDSIIHGATIKKTVPYLKLSNFAVPSFV